MLLRHSLPARWPVDDLANVVDEPADPRPAARVGADVALGHGVTIFHPHLVNLYGCAIGDDSRIGTFVEIQKGARIGARCKISSHSFICEGVQIDDEVFIGHGVMFTNDPRPRATNADGRLAGR